MKTLLFKIARFIWTWRTVKVLLWLVTLIVFFYVEEDWRGARAWAHTKAQWEARGESFDEAQLIPPPIPDRENLGAIPLFAVDPASGRAENLQRAFDHYPKEGDDPKLGLDRDGHFYDFATAARNLAAKYALAFHHPPLPEETPLQQFEALYPFLAELRAAADARPRCRFAVDYTPRSRLTGRSFQVITLQIRLAQILRLHASLALQQNQPDQALSDLRLLFCLSTATAQEPTLVSSLVSIGMNAIGRAVIAHGLALHEWNDAQLTTLQQDLAPIDSLAQFQFAMRGELNCFILPTLEYLYQRPHIRNLFPVSGEPPPILARNSIFRFWPDGWLAFNEVGCTNHLLTAVSFANPSAHQFAAQRAEDTITGAFRNASSRGPAFAPWNLFSTISLGPILSATVTFAQSQANLDQTRIACALERHRLRHGVYPSSLTDLGPESIPALPHDIIDGQPYCYRLRHDGTYLLYSVGWNQKDDGGQIVRDLPDPIAEGDSPRKHGDWVWPH